ncbi:MAG: hypothetical protein NTNFB02_08960 [Nitrospira sp.]
MFFLVIVDTEMSEGLKRYSGEKKRGDILVFYVTQAEKGAGNLFLGEKVLRAEHLVAICLQTGRAKDRERVRILQEEADLDSEYLSEILRRHQLEGKWKEWTA